MAKKDDDKQRDGVSRTIRPGDDSAASKPVDEALEQTIAMGQTSLGGNTKPDEREGPRQFGDYELLDEIARGGMGVVYRARQKSLNRIVAVKTVLAGQLATDDEIQRFRAEAEAAANLDHPGIVPIYEVGETDGDYFYSMGFVDGPSLKQRVSDGPLPPREAAELVRSIAEAVAFAHDNGIIHRDLKPANILFDQKGHVRVTDFGLAKQIEGDSDLTATGQVLGTPMYMPPEQAAGKADEIGPTADVYSLGAVLYELLVGHPPFQAASPILILKMVLEREPASPRQLNPAVDKDLETICLKCMQKEAAARYATPHELVDELGRFLDGEPIKARPINRIRRTARWCRRKPIAAGLVATGALLLLSLGIGGFVVAAQQSKLNRQISANAEQQEQIVSQREQAVEDQAEFAAEQERLASVAQREANKSIHSAYSSSISLAYEAYRAGDWERAKDLIERLRPSKEADTDVRGFDWYFLNRAIRVASDDDSDLTTFETLKVQGGQGHAVAYAPNGKWLATTGRKNTIRVWNMQSNPPEIVHELAGIELTLPAGQRQLGPNAFLRSVKFSEDSKLLATASGNDFIPGPLCIWDVETGEELFRVGTLKASIHDMVFNHDGTELVTVDGSAPVQGNIIYWDTSSGEQLRSHPGNINEIRSVDLSPDGTVLAIGGGWGDDRGEARLVDYETGELIHNLIGPSKQVGSIKFSPDGERVLTVEGFWFGDGGITVWDVESAEAVMNLKGHSSSVYAAAYSPNGYRIATAGRDQKIHLWDAVSGDHLAAIEGHQAAIYDLAFSPDEDQLVSVGQQPGMKSEVLVWEASKQGEPIVLRGHQDFVIGTGFLSNRDRALPKVVSLGKDRITRVWDLSKEGLEVDSAKLTNTIPLGLVAAGDNRFLIAELINVNQLPHKKLTFCDGNTLDEISSNISTHIPMRLASSQDGSLVAIAEYDLPDSRVAIRDLPSLEQRKTLRFSSMIVGDLAFSPDGEFLAASTIPADEPTTSSVKIIDCKSGEIVRQLQSTDGVFGAFAFSPDGTRVLTSESAVNPLSFVPNESSSLLRIYDLNSGELESEHLLDINGITDAHWTMDGVVLVSFDSGCAVWDEATESFSWKHDVESDDIPDMYQVVSSVSNDGRFLAVAGPNYSLELFDVSTGRPLVGSEATAP